MSVLSTELRKKLEEACTRARRASEDACRAALGSLGVAHKNVPAHLGEPDRSLRRGLRAKSRQLGDPDGTIELLTAECAYEQWHRLLFARFLAENGLLIHPEYRAPVTLAECDELAEDLSEPDGWAVAGRFAAEVLPGIFRLDDPCVQLPLAPEGRLALEQIVAGLPTGIFTADDALGWVYQFWQKDKKDEVNASERKIGGADLGPVTQLFTENYMVRFLLENSLGAWWAARHPDSALIKEWAYLRFDDEGALAAGAFEQWPDRVAEVTVMDPCCGSGHFLVEAFQMLWQMRVEEEDLDPVPAQDAVLRDNLFGLELDSRCVQIAMFAVALQAWKAGGGWRELPTPNIACSGIPVKSPVEEWKTLALGDERLENALIRLHILFRDADTLGSLIDPRRSTEITDPTGLQVSFDNVDWDDIVPLLAEALAEEISDPASAVLGADAVGIARVADYLTRYYTLVATNVPYLSRSAFTPVLLDFCERHWGLGSQDLAAAFTLRLLQLARHGGSIAAVAPQSLLTLSSFEPLRRSLLAEQSWNLVARLGSGAFAAIGGEVVNVALLLVSRETSLDGEFCIIDLNDAAGPAQKQQGLSECPLWHTTHGNVEGSPGSRFTTVDFESLRRLSGFAECRQGIKTGDDGRYRRRFWEISRVRQPWSRFQSSVSEAVDFGGATDLVLWDSGTGSMATSSGSRIVGREAWGRRGVMVSQMGSLPVSRFEGDLFDTNASPIIPHDEALLSAIWHFCNSPEYGSVVRQIDQNIKVTNRTLVDVPFDVDRWRQVAEEADGLPEPWSDDPTQWLFEGRPEAAMEPLQVALGRLLGYRWPEQPDSDDLDALADDDAIVCLPPVLGERSAAERLQELLARAFGGTWSPARTRELLVASGSKKKDLESWLQDDFFKAHCKVFKNRPFIWQIWDGRKDGFSALVNYHRLDRPTLERLTYTYLGDWVERQTAGVRDDVAGGQERLAAAQDLRRRLELILEGEPPFDIHVRWKRSAEQPMGWEPDLNDGVRLNVRPFVQAGVLRSKFNVKWGKDRGKNPDGSERLNDLHFTLAEKQAARRGEVS